MIFMTIQIEDDGYTVCGADPLIDLMKISKLKRRVAINGTAVG